MTIRANTYRIECDWTRSHAFGLLLDRCKAWTVVVAAVDRDAEAVARRQGWRFFPARDLCPRHADEYLLESVEQ